jgi:putative transposase
MQTTESLAAQVGVRTACSALNVAPATFYRRRKPSPPPKPRPSPPLALSADQRQEVLETLRSPRFVDAAPREVWAQLLDDEKIYLCSVRTMYRYLEAEGETRERRNQLRRPSYTKPELLATAPNQVWSWDITKLKGPTKWSYFYLYVILDIFSRYVVGWTLAHRESKTLACKLIEQTSEKQGMPGRLTIHADRGPSMTSKPVALLLGELGITKTHSRPYTSNDNPYSEAQFKTLKYRPDFPDRFGSFEDAETHCQGFVDWYNTEHHHTGLALLTPEDVHYGRAEQILHQRAEVLQAAFDAHPSRFKGKLPHPGKLPDKAWINPPVQTTETTEKLH